MNARPPAHRLPALLAAAILTGTILALAPGADAQACLPPAFLGVDPSGTNIGKTESYGVRTVEVFNGGAAAQVITKVVFSSNPVDPLNEKKRIWWEPARSATPGWIVSAQNDVPPYTLTFESQPYTIVGAQRYFFNIGFTVLGNPGITDSWTTGSAAGPVQVQGFYVTCPSQAASYEMQPDSSKPNLAAGRVFDRLSDPFTEDFKDFTTPAVATVNPNGRLDTAEILFTERMDRSTFRLEDFRIGYSNYAYPLIDHEWLAPQVGAPGTSCVDEYGCDRLALFFEEWTGYDTGGQKKDGKMPEVTYIPGTLTDLAGNLMGNQGNSKIAEIDAAPPVFVGATAFDASDGVEPPGTETYEYAILFFSERVESAYTPTPADPPFCGAAGSLQAVNFQYFNGASGGGVQNIVPPTPCPAAPTIPDLIHPAPLPPKWSSTDASVAYVRLNSPLQNDDVVIRDDNLGQDPDRICAITHDTNFNPPPKNTFIRQATVAETIGATPFKPFLLPWNNCHDVQIPDVKSVRVDIGSDLAYVTFTTPVSSIDGHLIALKTGDLDVHTTTDGCPEGVIDVRHTAGSDFAIVQLDRDLCPTDVDGTPSAIRVAPTRVHGTFVAYKTLSGGDAIYNPDTSGGGSDNGHEIYPNPVPPEGEDGMGFVPHQDARFVDDIAPRVVRAETADTDGDGAIDGLFIELSEPVNDNSFCGNQVSSCVPAVGGSAHVVADIDYGYHPDWNVPSGDNDWKSRYLPKTRNAVSKVTWDSDLQSNDRFGYLLWLESEDASTRVRPINAEGFSYPFYYNDRGTTPRTGYVPELIVMVQGLFEDLVASHCLVEGTAASCPPWALVRPNEAIVQDQFTDIHEADKAPPAILRAETVETRSLGATTQRDVQLGRPCLISAPFPADWSADDPPECKDDGDGHIDGVRLFFSEPVQDATFEAKHWKVDGGARPVLGMLTHLWEFDTPDDDSFVLRFGSSGLDPDTDARPDINYVEPTVADLAAKALADPVGNRLRDVEKDDVTEVDRARPVLVSSLGFIGADNVTVTFSEPVDDGKAGPLTRSDLTYANHFVPDPEDNEPSSNGIAPGETTAIKHVAGERSLKVILAGTLHEKDLKQDQISAEVNVPNEWAVYETQPTLPPAQRQHANRYFITLGTAPDTTPPAQIVDLAVDRERANSARISFTAPGDDGNEGDPVAKYCLGISTSPLLDDAATVANLCGDHSGEETEVTIEPDPAVAANILPPGSRQEFLVTGLAPLTTYYVRVTAQDDSPAKLTGPLSPEATFSTLDDNTVPVGLLVVTSETHQPNLPTLETDGEFSWNALTDPESTVEYHYRLNQVEDYSVVAGDPGTTGTEVSVVFPELGDDWWFHVRAFSAAGPQPDTVSYGPLSIGFTDIPLPEIQAANNDLKATTFARQTDQGNEINWTLPEASALPGVLEAVEIWRMEEGIYTLIARIGGSYEELRDRNYTDYDGLPTDRYLVTLSFRDSQRDPQPTGATYGLGAAAEKEKGKDQVPDWVWVLLGVALALIIAGIVIFFVLRSRAHEQPTTPGGLAYAWEDASGSSTQVDPATGMPIHEVQCPSCKTQFQAVGVTPLPVTCPTCGTPGQLD